MRSVRRRIINLLPGKDGLLHISQIAHERVEKVTDYLSEGQIVKVKVMETARCANLAPAGRAAQNAANASRICKRDSPA